MYGRRSKHRYVSKRVATLGVAVGPTSIARRCCEYLVKKIGPEGPIGSLLCREYQTPDTQPIPLFVYRGRSLFILFRCCGPANFKPRSGRPLQSST